MVQPGAQRPVDQRVLGVFGAAGQADAAQLAGRLALLANMVDGKAVMPFGQLEQRVAGRLSGSVKRLPQTGDSNSLWKS
jgi:hypothetical protein